MTPPPPPPPPPVRATLSEHLKEKQQVILGIKIRNTSKQMCCPHFIQKPTKKCLISALVSKKWMNQKGSGAEKLHKVKFAEIIYQRHSDIVGVKFVSHQTKTQMFSRFFNKDI